MKSKKKITGAVLLRADYNKQATSGALKSNEHSLVSEEQFWGTENKPGLYYDYENEDNKFGYTVAREGWDDYAEKYTERMNADRTRAWINDKILKGNETNICVIQGYAGCGKSTFVHGILRKIYAKDIFLSYYNFYIGYVKNSTEDKFIKSSIYSKVLVQIMQTLQAEDGMNIYNQFIELFDLDLSILSPVLSRYFTSFFCSDNDTSVYQHAKAIHNNRNTDNVKKCKKTFKIQFDNAYEVIEHRLSNSKGESEKDNLDILLFIDYLWRCAVYLVRDASSDLNQIVVYDNLDIIENHHIVANFIDTLRSVLANYNALKEATDLELPTFKVLLTVRKITYASVSRFVEVGCNAMNQNPPDVDFLDISNLYIPSNIIKHKASIISSNIDSYVTRSSDEYEEIVSFLHEILEVPDEIFSDIKFSELLNHNIRACINMMDEVLHNDVYIEFCSKFKAEKHLNNRVKSSVWVFIICTILRKYKIWESLGYNLCEHDKVNCPTTLSRMILTYLCNQRLGCMRERIGFESSDVSFAEIINALEKIPFGVFLRNSSWENDIIPALKQNHTRDRNCNLIADSIAKMLKRNANAEGLELWRRPIYYTKNAFMISDINSTKSKLLAQIQNFNQEDAIITSFCITDEGYTFVESIATHFEFYSVRYNNNISKPLCCVDESEKLDELIKGVFNQVEICAKKQVWIMNYYMEKYAATKNEYLEQLFHPRTDSFEPQLHIVRTIYDHIKYLNDYRMYLYEVYSNKTEEKFKSLNICLLKWIGKYLQLYKVYLYDALKQTCGEYNNNVWLDLKYLYWLVFKDSNKIGQNFKTKKRNYITINRNQSSISRIFQYEPEYAGNRISDDELLNNPMLLE